MLHLVGGWRGGEPLHKEPLADWDLLHDLLIRTVQHTTRAFHDALVASEHGRFVLVSAKQAQAPTNDNAAYAAAKAAAEAWTLALADGFVGTGATANIIVVEAILTPRMREENPGEKFPTFTPAEHLAEAIVFVCSGAAAQMNGQRLPLTMRRMSKPDQAPMTIGELARRTGMTVRNIRAHQTRGLLPPPEVRGRTGFYGEEHVARISLTREMQADGLNLEAIRRLLESADESGSSEILDFTRALRAPFEDEAPEIIDGAEMAKMWGEDPDPKLIERAEQLGIVRRLPEGRYEIISPRLQRAGVELARLGISPDAALDTVEKLRQHSEGVARTFIDLFVSEVWEPFDAAGRPRGDWQKVREALERLRPLAAESLLATFQLVMGEATERASERTLRLEAEGSSKRPEGGR